MIIKTKTVLIFFSLIENEAVLTYSQAEETVEKTEAQYVCKILTQYWGSTKVRPATITIIYTMHGRAVVL